MLHHLYYLYEKSPKKCHNLDEVVMSPRQCFEMSSSRGNRPLCACGTRFIDHKIAAISRFLDKYGAYICHLQIYLVTEL